VSTKAGSRHLLKCLNLAQELNYGLRTIIKRKQQTERYSWGSRARRPGVIFLPGRLDASNNFVHDYPTMTKTGMQKLFAGLLVVAGIVLLVMYAMLRVNKAGPSNGMLVVGLVDLFVGVVLLRRAMAAGKTM
jgi:hypothetical protein